MNKSYFMSGIRQHQQRSLRVQYPHSPVQVMGLEMSQVKREQTGQRNKEHGRSNSEASEYLILNKNTTPKEDFD
jgi:hypothetical protein